MDNNMDKYLGTCLDDRYEIVEVIGAGGMAVVYKAIDQRLNRFVAVKILRDELARDEEFRARFQICLLYTSPLTARPSPSPLTRFTPAS